MIPKKAQEILDFWFKETPAEKRFKKDETFDQTIKDRFIDDYELASQNEYDDWQDQPMSALALVILFDQFSRNMFRDDKKAFAQDHKTRLIVNDAVYGIYMANYFLPSGETFEYSMKEKSMASVKVLKAYALETGIPETNWNEGVNKAVDKYYGSKYDKVKTDECHTFLEGLIPNGKERVNKVVQTLY